MQITGGGSTQPATVSFPGAYSGTDPGIKINIYQTLTSYTIPGTCDDTAIVHSEINQHLFPTSGPAVFSCNGASAPGTTSAPAQPTTTVVSTPTTTSASAPTTSSAAGTVVHYGQCGGLSYAHYSLTAL